MSKKLANLGQNIFLRYQRSAIGPLNTLLAIGDIMTFEEYKFAPGLLGWKMRFEGSDNSIFDTDEENTEQFEAFREMFDPNWDGKESEEPPILEETTRIQTNVRGPQKSQQIH